MWKTSSSDFFSLNLWSSSAHPHHLGQNYLPLSVLFYWTIILILLFLGWDSNSFPSSKIETRCRDFVIKTRELCLSQPFHCVPPLGLPNLFVPLFQTSSQAVPHVRPAVPSGKTCCINPTQARELPSSIWSCNSRHSLQLLVTTFVCSSLPVTPRSWHVTVLGKHIATCDVSLWLWFVNTKGWLLLRPLI